MAHWVKFLPNQRVKTNVKVFQPTKRSSSANEEKRKLTHPGIKGGTIHIIPGPHNRKKTPNRKNWLGGEKFGQVQTSEPSTEIAIYTSGGKTRK